MQATGLAGGRSRPYLSSQPFTDVWALSVQCTSAQTLRMAQFRSNRAHSLRAVSVKRICHSPAKREAWCPTHVSSVCTAGKAGSLAGSPQPHEQFRAQVERRSQTEAPCFLPRPRLTVSMSCFRRVVSFWVHSVFRKHLLAA